MGNRKIKKELERLIQTESKLLMENCQIYHLNLIKSQTEPKEQTT
jgi:hypothetical protein